MWKQWTMAVMGLIFIFIPFLGLTTFIFKAVMAFGGVVFAVLGFWILSEENLSTQGGSASGGKKESFVAQSSDEF